MASSYNENQHRDRAGQDGPLGKARHAAGAAKDRAVGFAKDPDVKRLGGQLLGTARALWEVASSDEAKGVYRKAGDALKDAWARDDAGAGATARRRGVLGAGTAGTAAPHAATGIDPDMVSGTGPASSGPAGAPDPDAASGPASPGSVGTTNTTNTTGPAGAGGATNPSGLPHPSGPAGTDGTA